MEILNPTAKQAKKNTEILTSYHNQVQNEFNVWEWCMGNQEEEWEERENLMVEMKVIERDNRNWELLFKQRQLLFLLAVALSISRQKTLWIISDSVLKFRLPSSWRRSTNHVNKVPDSPRLEIKALLSHGADVSWLDKQKAESPQSVRDAAKALIPLRRESGSN